MGVYDQSARYATTAEPTFVLRRLRPLLELDLTFRRWFDTKGLPLPGGPDRDADLVAIADEPIGDEPKSDEPKPWLLIFEFQAQHDPEKANVLQLETMVFLCHAKDIDRGGGKFLPLPVFVYLKGECPNPTVSIQTPSGCGFTGRPAVWEIGKDSASETLAKVESGELSWGAMFWVSLMNGAHEDTVIDHWRRLLDEKVPQTSRGDVAYIASQFAELVGTKIAWNRKMQGVTMTESAIANEMIELGQMRMARQALLVILREQLPDALTPDVERAIADQPNLDLLSEWMVAAARAKSAEEFLAVLRR